MDRPLIWLMGDREHAEFAPAVAWLESAAVQDADFPAAIVVCQSRPGAVAQDEIESLHHRAPLARLIVLTGTWCEGELRSGRPCQGVTRIPWQQWQVRLPHELALATYRPRTLTEVDRLLRTVTPALCRRAGGLAAIATASRETFSTLADAAWAAGLRSVWQQPGAPPQSELADVLLVDGWGCHAQTATPPAAGPPSILLLDWPRAADLERAAGLGIGVVLAKPWLLTDLLAAIDLLAGNIRSRAAA